MLRAALPAAVRPPFPSGPCVPPGPQFSGKPSLWLSGRGGSDASGSWGAAPSVFWYGAPGGTQGPLGKGGAAERWRVTPSVSGVTRHGAQPATTRTHKRNATPARRTYYALYKATRRRQATTNLFQNSFASFCRSKRKVSAASGANRHPPVIPPRRRREEIMA